MNIFPYRISVDKSHPYCVYLTTYKGNRLPPFYFGSSSVQKVLGGYSGSVKSKKWSKIYETEQRDHPELFSTTILRTTKTRKVALGVELFLQKKNDVIKSPFFFNESFAQKNGMFGRDVSKENHPLWGVGHTKETCVKIKENHYDCSGDSNSRAKTIEIYDVNDNLILTTVGNFISKCNEYDLPHRVLTLSYQQEKRLYEKGTRRVKEKWKKYKGWYAVDKGIFNITKENNE